MGTKAVNTSLVFAVTAYLTLVGCGPSRQASFRQYLDACLAASPATRGNYEKRGLCWQGAWNIFYPTESALKVLGAGRVAIGQRADRGEITAQEAEFEFTRLYYEVEQQTIRTESMRNMELMMLLRR